MHSSRHDRNRKLLDDFENNLSAICVRLHLVVRLDYLRPRIYLIERTSFFR